MTITIDRRSKTHIGNGVTTVFPYDFLIPDEESVRVYVLDTETEEQTEISSGAYSITGLNEETFGSVTYPLWGTPLPSTKRITIAREVAYTQDLDIQNQGGFFPEALEDQLDRIVMQIQQVANEAQGALRGQIEDIFDRLPPKSVLAGKWLKFDETGEPFGAENIDLMGATFATENEARAGASTATIMSPRRVFQAINARDRLIYPEDFIIEDTLDGRTAGLQAFFNTLATEGGVGALPRWYEINGSIAVPSASAAFTVRGAGKYVSGLRRASVDEFGVLDITADDFVLRDFGIDGGRSTWAGTDQDGLKLLGSRWEAVNLYVSDVSGTGILGTANTGETEMLGTVQGCHVDGTGGARKGISLESQINGVIAGCFVENIHSSTDNIAIGLKGCSNTAIANAQVRNSFTSVKIEHGESDGSNNQISDLMVTSPNSTSSSGPAATGLWLAGGTSLGARGVAIDGGNQPGMIACLIDTPDNGASVEMRVANLIGLDSYALTIQDSEFSIVAIHSLFNVNDLFVHMKGAGSTRNTVLIGRREGSPIYAPIDHVNNDPGHITNLIQLLNNNVTQVIALADDEATSILLTDGVVALLKVAAADADAFFDGRCDLSVTPNIDGHVGSAAAVGTTALTTGTGNGVDGKLNIAATNDRIYFKNRLGGNRRVVFTLVLG